jgi:hypothetical protein
MRSDTLSGNGCTGLVAKIAAAPCGYAPRRTVWLENLRDLSVPRESLLCVWTPPSFWDHIKGETGRALRQNFVVASSSVNLPGIEYKFIGHVGVVVGTGFAEKRAIGIEVQHAGLRVAARRHDAILTAVMVRPDPQTSSTMSVVNPRNCSSAGNWINWGHAMSLLLSFSSSAGKSRQRSGRG